MNIDEDLVIEEERKFILDFCYPVRPKNAILAYRFEDLDPSEFFELGLVIQKYDDLLGEFISEDQREIFIAALNKTPARAMFGGIVKSINPGNGYVVIKKTLPAAFM